MKGWKKAIITILVVLMYFSIIFSPLAILCDILLEIESNTDRIASK